MSTVRRLLPTSAPVDLDDTLAALSATPAAHPFADEVMTFVADFARGLSRRGRGFPETEALAFWMRRSEMTRLKESFAALASDRVVLAPRGTVFHIPPANVDTLFVYSWLLATVVGNRAVVRLSTRATDQANLILDVLAGLLQDHPFVAERTVMVSYGHDQSITSRISQRCDVRVVWGGDATIDTIRRSPLPAHATELTFPDRFSMAAIELAAYAALTPARRNRLAEKFFNDAYWFDQLGCSSARLVVWVGDVSKAGELSRDFFGRLRAIIDTKGYAVDTATAVAKRVHAYGSMIDAPVVGYSGLGNELTVLPVTRFPEVRGDFCGGGLFYSLHAASLLELTEHLERRDQTLAWFGFGAQQLRELAWALNGRGLDRIVPVGTALDFDRIWDGHDLLQAFSRRVVIDATPAVLE